MTFLFGLSDRLKMAKLYLFTDTRSGSGDFAQFIEDAFAGGVDIIGVREPNLSPKAELEALATVRALATAHQGLVVVNDSLQLAREFGSDVLQLDPDADPAAGRQALHEWGLIGQSVHSSQQVDRAGANPDVDYFCVCNATSSTDSTDPKAAGSPTTAGASTTAAGPIQGPGLDLVRYAAAKFPPRDSASKPWFAAAEITADNLDQVLEAGARRVMVGRAITAASNPRTAAEELSTRLRRAWREDMPTLPSAEPAKGRWFGRN